MHFEADQQPPADSSPRDHLITVVKETVKSRFEKLKKVKIAPISHRFHSAKTLLTVRLPVTVLKPQRCKNLKQILPGHTATH